MIRHALAAALLGLSWPAAAAPADPLIAKLEALAESGNAKALYHLGMAYQTGSGVPLDYVRALAYFRDAAARGDPLAAYKLGCFHAGQDGVLPVDPDKALHYKLVAAEAGYALAQSDVAALYLQRGDPAAAKLWIDRAAAQGPTIALAGAATIYSGRTIVPRDSVLTAFYMTLMFDRIADAGVPRDGIDRMRAALSPAERRRVDAMVAAYRPALSALTTEALSGRQAAEELVRR